MSLSNLVTLARKPKPRPPMNVATQPDIGDSDAHDLNTMGVAGAVNIEAELGDFAKRFSVPRVVDQAPPPARAIEVERAIVADDIAALERKLATERADIAAYVEAARVEAARRTVAADEDEHILAGKRDYLAWLEKRAPSAIAAE